ncbi:MAG: hypothetical protein Ta2B_03210 [Termitinemataceae bacterium]|nr:MAG: hypothetical protein Ta2B_03210 [Termitinemataceae bacterium]
MNILNKKIPAACIVALVVGVLIGSIFGVNLLKKVDEKTEVALSWDALDIKSVAEEEALAASMPMQGSLSLGGLSQQKMFDGVALAASMPVESETAWISWMRDNRADSAEFLAKRWKLSTDFRVSGELGRWEDVRAFLLTPREHFVRERNKGKEYADTWLPIGWGATITDPDVVAMMTTTLNITNGEKVLEIGTGSGYQSAILSYLTNDVYSIEIIKPLFEETDKLYSDLEAAYPSYGSIRRKLGDGYYGWESEAPFDKIIVTCSIDHIPPPLLQQLKPGGIMVLPLGPPGRQYIMEVKKNIEADGTVTLARRDVYNGLWVSFIPFRNESGSAYKSATN